MLTRLTSILMVAALVLGSACSRAPKSGPEIGWPPPPKEPRIVYQSAIYGSQSLNRSFWGKFTDFLFGKATDSFIGKPYGLALGPDKRIYIADTARKGIMVIDRQAGKTSFFNSLGQHGQLQEPVYIVLDHENNIYVADSKLGKIAVFDSQFKFLYFIGDKGQLVGPVGLEFDKSGERLIVVDTQDHKIKLFERGGKMIRSFGQRGDGEGEFYYPISTALTKGDTLYVVDSFHFAIQAFNLDGQYLFSFGPFEGGGSILARPRDIAVDSDNNLYITDALSNNVKIFNGRGQLLLRFGSAGTSPGQFRLPAGITFDNDDNLYIADSMNGRIQIFKYLGQS